MNYFYIKWGRNNDNWFTTHNLLYEAMMLGESIGENEGGHYYQIEGTDKCTVLYFESEEEFKQHFIEYFI